jgi:hypothetical protein
MATRSMKSWHVLATRTRAIGGGAILWMAMLGWALASANPVYALNGQNAQTIGVFETPAGIGGDFVIACPASGPNGDQLNGTCQTTTGQFLRGFLDPEGLRVVRSGDTLQNVTVRAHAFGSLAGTSAGDVACWTFQRRGGGPLRSRDIKACASVAAGSCSGPASRCAPTCDGLATRQNNNICNSVAAQLQSPETLAYVFAVDTSRLGQSGSAVLTTCQNFVAQCAQADMAASGVTIKSTRPIDASDGDPYSGGRYW